MVSKKHKNKTVDTYMSTETNFLYQITENQHITMSTGLLFHSQGKKLSVFMLATLCKLQNHIAKDHENINYGKPQAATNLDSYMFQLLK